MYVKKCKNWRKYITHHDEEKLEFNINSNSIHTQTKKMMNEKKWKFDVRI